MAATNPEEERRVQTRLEGRDVYVHPTAIVETSDVGDGTRVWGFAHVLSGAHIGERCNIGGHSFVEGGSWIGNDVTLKNGNMVWEGVRLEDGVFVGPGVIFTNDLNPRSPRLAQAGKRYADKGWLAKTIVYRGATLGAGAIIVANRSIGEFSLVAAGAVVTRDVPAYGLVMGNPARLVGWVCQCGQRLTLGDPLNTADRQRAECGNCCRHYSLRTADGGPFCELLVQTSESD